ncbi:DUF2066 domain-containing protein [Shewanella aestuarii]|uniref:DUF2066 domain-containing protein n=1 Tax=Shewanella aestuarii TaxID=1028752 RepID=A0A6G9QIL1_9GAMM|nr:DUF2066 domain-containing protein [Shewanella aestuarii]QIR14394.1 DUF2066 domain-containing protein [Shewanella aestuarii]
MLKNIIKLFALSIAIYSHATVAVEVSQLDEADIVVPSRASNIKVEALKEALAKVFVKNSGSPSVVMHPLVKAQIDNPEVLLTQYGYRQVDDNLVLSASFDHKRIIDTLRQADLAVWGAQRPLTLLWLTVEQDNETVILADSSNNPLRASFASSSINKGIPLLLPLMDLDDLMAVSATDVKGMFTDVVSDSSARYQADYFAIADITPTVGAVRFQISLFDKTRQNGLLQPLIMQQGQTVDENAAVNRIVSLLADYYIGQYAIASTGNSIQTSVSFVGIDSMSQLVELESYLKQLSAVKAISVKQLQNNIVAFNVSLFGSVDDLQRLLNIDKRLSKIDAMGGVDAYRQTPNAETVQLIYEWIGQ